MMGICRSFLAVSTIAAAVLLAYEPALVAFDAFMVENVVNAFTAPAFPDRLASIPIPRDSEGTGTKVATDGGTYEYNDADWSAVGSAIGLNVMNEARCNYFSEQISLKNAPAKKSKPARVLDMGCGGGLVSVPLAQAGFNVTGIDLSDKSIAIAKKRAAAVCGKTKGSSAASGCGPIEFRTGDAYTALDSVEAGAFDAVVMADFLEHIHDLRRLLKAVHKVVRPNGLVCFDTISRTAASFFVTKHALELTGIIPSGTHDWRMFITPDETQRLFKEEGFKTAEINSLSPTPAALANVFALRLGLSDTIWSNFTVKPVQNASSIPMSYIGCAQRLP